MISPFGGMTLNENRKTKRSKGELWGSREFAEGVLGVELGDPSKEPTCFSQGKGHDKMNYLCGRPFNHVKIIGFGKYPFVLPSNE